MKKHIPALIIFTILLVVMTFPLAPKINSYMPGFFSTDEIYAPVWDAWRVKFSFENGLPIGKTNLIAYPFGVDFYKNQPIGYLWYFINYSLAILTSVLLTYNIQVMVNFLLMLFCTYFLVYYLTRDRLCAFFSGIIFGFSPYMFARSWQHLSETYLWPIPLFLWILFKLGDRGDTLRIRILFVVSFVLTSINFNDTYYTSIILMTFLIYLANSWRDKKAYIAKIITLMPIALLIIAPTFFPFFKNLIHINDIAPSSFSTYHRSFEDLFLFSAKPLSYLLPAAEHPILGKITEQFIGSPFYGISFTEHTLYLGWVPLILAFIALRKWRQGRRQKTEDRKQIGEDFYIGFFVTLAITAWLFSQPPWWRIGQIKIYMPSFFMYKVLPMFRAYCRFGIVVMLAVSVLSGFGLKCILGRLKIQKSKIAITVLFCGLVLFEFWNYPPFKVIDISRVPQVYYWLKEQPGDFSVVEYPLDSNGPNEMYKFHQITHEKKIINGSIPGSYANKVAKTIVKLSDSHTAGVLKWMGVKYVLVHAENYLNSELVQDREEFDKISHNSGLKLIKSFASQECLRKDIMCVQKTGPIDVYEVKAQPTEPKIKE